MSWIIKILNLLIIFDISHASRWSSENIEGQCMKVIRQILKDDQNIVEDYDPTRLYHTWLSQECEVRAGPDYIIRKYTFFDNGTFLLERYHYAEESCSIATHTVVGRGSIRLGLSSTIISGATETEFHMHVVHVVPLNRQIANKFGRRLNESCSLQPKWRPYVAQTVYESLHQYEYPSWYDPKYNSLQSYPSSKKEKTIDCLEKLGIEFDELSILRIQKKPLDQRSIIPDSIYKSKFELAFANVPPNVQSRWIYRPTSLQSTMLVRMDTISECPICIRISQATERNPPLLHEVAPLPALLGGSWISSHCESVKGGLWSRRYMRMHSGDKLWTGRWDYYSDPRCTIFSYSITAAGSYLQRAGGYISTMDNTKSFQSSWNPFKLMSRLKRNVDEAYRYLFRKARPALFKPFAAMLKGNQKHEMIQTNVKISSDIPRGTTELDLHVAESFLIPGDKSIVDRCDGEELMAPLSIWPNNCVPLAIEAPSTLRLRAKVGVSWTGQYILRLGSRDDDIWDMPLRQCGLTNSHNPKLRTFLRKSLGLKYGLSSSAISFNRISHEIIVIMFLFSLFSSYYNLVK